MYAAYPCCTKNKHKVDTTWNVICSSIAKKAADMRFSKYPSRNFPSTATYRRGKSLQSKNDFIECLFIEYVVIENSVCKQKNL